MSYAYVNGQSEKVDDLTMLQNTPGSSQKGFLTILAYAKTANLSFLWLYNGHFYSLSSMEPSSFNYKGKHDVRLHPNLVS